MYRGVSNFVPRLLTQDQRDSYVAIRQECWIALARMKISEKNITGDETWVNGYDVETKIQSSKWLEKFAKTEKEGRVRTNAKVMLTAFFFDMRHEFLRQEQTGIAGIISKWPRHGSSG